MTIRDYLKFFGVKGGKRDDNAAIGATKSTEGAKTPPVKSGAQPAPRNNSLFRFDGPLRLVHVTRKTMSGPVFALFDDADGRAWSISAPRESLDANASITATEITLGDDVAVTDWCELWENTIIFWRIDGPRERLDVRDIRDGAVLYSTLCAMTAVLAPNGRHVLLFEEDGIAVVDLDAPEKPPRKSGLFPIENRGSDEWRERLDYQLDNPSSAAAIAVNKDEDFTLAIGDYGFAVAATVRIGRSNEPPLIVTQAARAYATGLVYDPVDIIDVVPDDALLVRHGYGSGIARFDLQTGAAAHCPLPNGQTERDYGTFQFAVSSTGSRLVCIQTNTGHYVWDESGALKRAPEEARTVLATDGDRFLSLSPDGWDIVRGRF